MQLSFKSVNRTLIILVIGDIDHHTSEDIRNRIDNQIDSNSIKNVVFDFSKASFMDSAGIGVIIGRYKKVSQLGGKVAIANVGPQIKRILEISGILRISQLYNNVDAALKDM